MRTYSNLNSATPPENHFKSGSSSKTRVGRGKVMQKAIMFFVALCISAVSAFAQDIIVSAGQSQVRRPSNTQRRVQNHPKSPIDYEEFTELRADDDAMEAFLKENDDDLYKQFHAGATLRQNGKTMLGIGIGITGVGIVMTLVGLSGSAVNGDDSSAVLALAGLAGIGVGQTLTIISIPLSAVGGGLKKRAANGYEEKYFKSNRKDSRTSLNFTFTGNGVGLAFRF